MLQTYFDQIIASLTAAPWVDTLHLVRLDRLEIEKEAILVYRIRVDLRDGGLIEISERLIFSLKAQNFKVTMYRFHWQDENGTLIKRWDNAPHHNEIATYPHHVHVGEESNVVENNYLSAQEIIHEIDKQFTPKR